EPIALKRHAGADGEKVSGLKAENRPAGDDLLDGENAVAKREFLFHFAVDGQLDLQLFQLAPRRFYEQRRAESGAGGEILAEEIVGGEPFAPVHVARGDVDHERDAAD